MADRRPPVGFIGLLAVAFGVCCALPILGSIGLAGAIAGLSLGSWVLVAAAVGVMAVGFWRLARRDPHCEVTTSPATSVRAEHNDVPPPPVVHSPNGAARDEQDL